MNKTLNKNIMDAHQRLCEINTRLFAGDDITEPERQKTVDFFLGEQTENLPSAFLGVGDGRDHAPLFYRPPWPDGKRARLITGHLPKTGILHANHYELEIIRLLLLFAPHDQRVRKMAAQTFERLERTCFGNFCPKGECVAASVCALRFYNAHCPGDAKRRQRLLVPLGKLFSHAGPGKSEWQCQLPVSYFLLALAETRDEIAADLIRAQGEWLQRLSVSNQKTWLALAARRALEIT